MERRQAQQEEAWAKDLRDQRVRATLQKPREHRYGVLSRSGAATPRPSTRAAKGKGRGAARVSPTEWLLPNSPTRSATQDAAAAGGSGGNLPLRLRRTQELQGTTHPARRVGVASLKMPLLPRSVASVRTGR